MPMYRLLVGNDTVPISVWRGGGMRPDECRLVRHTVDNGRCLHTAG